jgi:hypothetical protein
VSSSPQEPSGDAGGSPPPSRPDGGEQRPVPSHGRPPVPPHRRQVPPGRGDRPPSRTRWTVTEGLSIAGFLAGLLGLLLFWVRGVGVVLAIVGLVLSGLGLVRTPRGGRTAVLAIGGLTFSTVSLLLSVYMFVSAVAALAS